MEKITIETFKPYWQQLTLLVVACIVSIAVLVVGYSQYSHATFNSAQAIALQGELNLKIDELIEDKEFLDNIGESFSQIQAQGFFAGEDRLSWGEALKATALQLKLSRLKYSIRPQQQIANIGNGVPASLHLSQSTMDIEADLMHEGDFIALSNQLSDMPGLFRIIDCSLSKANEISVALPQKNMLLKCSLAWHTAKYELVDDDVMLDEFGLEEFE